MRPLPPSRLMAVWRDRAGRVVATVAQGVRIAQDGRPVAVYVTSIPGETQERKTFACASRAINEWAVRSGLRLTAGPP